MIQLRRALGALLAALALLPLWRILPGRDTGLAGRATAEIVGIQLSLLWTTFALVAAAGLLLGLFLSGDAPGRVGAWGERVLLRPRGGAFALGAGLAAFAATALAALLVFGGRPNLIDALAQLIHARYLAAGMAGGPADLPLAFFHVQNMVLTEAGWFSQYPPGHALLLAAGMVLGAPWIVGPLLVGGTAVSSVLALERLLPERKGLARGLGLLAGLSPMLVAHGAAYMNHASAAFFGTMAVWFALRSRDAASRASLLGWAAGAGAAVSAMATVRPLAAVAVMVTVAGGVWVYRDTNTQAIDLDLTALVERWGAATLGGLPFLLLHLGYNRWAFGSPLTFGYDRAWGEAHALGFHVDPYGNTYGPVEALAYTSAELSALNLNLLEIPLPLVALVGLYLLLHRRTPLPAGERVLLLWALLPVGLHLFYWHHGYFMGPRMLTDFVPAWVGLSGVAVVGLLARLPEALGPRARAQGSRLSPKGVGTGVVLAALVAGVFLAPQRVSSWGAQGVSAPEPQLDALPQNALVFLHGPFEGRLIGRLIEAGVDPVVVETAIRQNPACLVFDHLGDLAQGRPTPLDLHRRAFDYPHRTEVAPGVRVRMDPADPPSPACVRELRSDRFGVHDPAGTWWRGGALGLGAQAPVLARDLGPEANRRLIERFPDRTPWAWVALAERGVPALHPYDEAMRILWGAP
jgi:hypothetical protein